jgi:Coenzyme PQQ synthesis protein D (PqqD)
MHEHGSLPRAREDGLLEETIGEELLLYDLESHTAHCLNPIAARIWRHCDGEHDVTQLAQLAGADERLVAEALHELHERELVDAEPALIPGESVVSGVSRREAIVRVARYGAAAAAGSMIVSATAATAAMASSGEGCGGKEGRIQTLPEGTSLKFAGKVTHTITVMCIGGEVESPTESVKPEGQFKLISSTCPEKEPLKLGETCVVTIEHQVATKGQKGSYKYEWNNGICPEKKEVLLESE